MNNPSPNTADAARIRLREPPVLGWWHREGGAVVHGDDALRGTIRALDRAACLVRTNNGYAATRGGVAHLGIDGVEPDSLPVCGYIAPLPPSALGDPAFASEYGLAYAYMGGAMANGIASVELVEALARAGMLGSYGAAGQSLAQIERAIDEITARLATRPYCFNLIHSPAEPEHEKQVVELYLRRGIRLVEASAFLALTLPVVRYRVHGIHRDPEGNVVAPNRIIAKASRVEVASKWFAPPPEEMLRELIAGGELTEDQAGLAREIPMAQDLTAEADSGGHTDNRPAIALLPTMLALRARLQTRYGYAQALRVGAAGGIATPAATAAVFAMGAAYVVTGTVNQACVESGSCDQVRQMLADAEQADVIMAPAADMFEMGVKLQVLKRGTLFAMRAAKLYEMYVRYASLDAIPATERADLERTIFRAPIARIWEQTREFFAHRDTSQLTRAATDPKHAMALVFRWYLGQSSRWANAGEASRQADYQIWCGPSMGAFNEWSRDSFLAGPQRRTVVTVALNLLHGAAVLTRIRTLLDQGMRLSAAVTGVEPLTLEQMEPKPL